MTPWLTIVGVGSGGVAELPAAAQAVIAAAETIVGAERLRPDAAGSQDFIPWTSPLAAMLDQLDARRGHPTVVLATGDPMWFGIGATLAGRLPAEPFAVIPQPSAFQLAAAALRWPLQHLVTLSLHGRAVEAIHPHILPGNRILALTGDRGTLVAVAAILVARGYGQSQFTVLEHLGGAMERITAFTAAEFTPTGIGDFHTLALDCVADAGAPLLPPVPGLPDDAFVSDGQLTKREVRAATLARLAPSPGALLWDVGAGCGSIAIEWCRAARDAAALAFERDAARREMIARNAAALGATGIDIVAGEAPASFAGRPAPDAIFIGGEVGNSALFAACWAALKPGGRLVANAVTLDGEQELYARCGALGGDLVRIEIAVLEAVGRHRALRPRLPVTQYAVQKP